MSIKQFNVTYIRAEDRLLLRVNTSEDIEIRLWLTRLININLLSAIRKIIHQDLEKKYNPQIAQVIQEFHEEKIKKSENFLDPYIKASKLPLGTDPILVIGFKLAYEEGQFSIYLKLHGGKNLNLKLPTKTIQSLISLLEQMEVKAQWAEYPTISSDGQLDADDDLRRNLQVKKINFH